MSENADGQTLGSNASPTSDSNAVKNQRDAYFALLEDWVRQANVIHNAQIMFPWYFWQNYVQYCQMPSMGTGMNPQGGPTAAANVVRPVLNSYPNAAPAGALVPVARSFGGLWILRPQDQLELIRRAGAYDCKIGRFWKRALAELIDFSVLLVIKVVLAFLFINFLDVDPFQLGLLQQQIFLKMIDAFYDAFWTSYGEGIPPGKNAMNLRVLYVEAVVPYQAPGAPGPRVVRFPALRGVQSAKIYPALTPNFTRALLRSVTKTLFSTVFFPITYCHLAFFDTDRTLYDILSKTIVVEVNPQV